MSSSVQSSRWQISLNASQISGSIPTVVRWPLTLTLKVRIRAFGLAFFLGIILLVSAALAGQITGTASVIDGEPWKSTSSGYDCTELTPRKAASSAAWTRSHGNAGRMRPRHWQRRSTVGLLSVKDAPIHAAMRADAMLKAGDVDGYAVWKRIIRAVGELQRAEPGARVH